MIDMADYEGGRRDVLLGASLTIAVTLIVACCFVGAYTIGSWLWSLT